MSTYELFDSLLKSNKVTTAAVSRATGIATSTFSEWKNGKYTPKPDKLQKIADHFNVPLTYFYPDAQLDDYYVDPEATAIAQKLASTPGAKTLLDAFCDMPKEDAEFILQMVEKLTSK